MTSSGSVKVTQVRSAIGAKPKHRGTLRALGLRGVGRSRVLPDRPEVRAMINKVPHLVTVTSAEESEALAQKERSEASRSARRAGERRAGEAPPRDRRAGEAPLGDRRAGGARAEERKTDS